MVTIATPYVKIPKCIETSLGLSETKSQVPRHQYTLHTGCFAAATSLQSLLFVPYKHWYRKRRNQNQKQRHCPVFFSPLTNSGFQTVQHLPHTSVNLYASVVNTIKMAVKTDTIISWCLQSGCSSHGATRQATKIDNCRWCTTQKRQPTPTVMTLFFFLHVVSIQTSPVSDDVFSWNTTIILRLFKPTSNLKTLMVLECVLVQKWLKKMMK